MRSSTAVLALIVLSSAPRSTILAQYAAPVTIGERVRITTPSQRGPFRYVGSVVAVQGDSLFLQTREMAAPRTVAIADISTIEISLGKESNTRRGMLYGSVIGVAAGALLGAATYKRPRCADAIWLCDTPNAGRGIDALAGGIVGGVGGLAIGGLWGASHPSERWVMQALGSGRGVGLAPARRGAVVSLSTRF